MTDNRRVENGITVLDRLDRSVIFSISADAGTLAAWRAYIEAKGVGTAETVIAAMAEHMARNPLTPQEMETYNELMSDLSWSKSWASWRTWRLSHGSVRGDKRGAAEGASEGSQSGGSVRDDRDKGQTVETVRGASEGVSEYT